VVTMKSLLLLLLLLLIAPEARAEQNRLTLETMQVSDSDDARQSSYYLKYRRSFSRTTWAGVGLGTRDFSDDFGDQRFTALTAEYQQPLPASLAFRGAATQHLSSEWSPFSGYGTLVYTPGPKWYVEASAGYDFVDTYTAIRLETQFTTFGISADCRFHEDWTAVGYVYRQDFTDDNVRQGVLARLVWEMNAIEWLRSEVSFRHVGSDQRGVGYFSPDSLTEALAVLTASRAFFNDNAALGLKAGAGWQGIDSEFNQVLYLAELSGRGWFTDHWGLRGSAGFRNTGEVAIAQSSDGYFWGYADLGLIYSW